ncbi:MAG: T9SS type A sorting domain-containing protein [Bacteroidaceae bacterium]|nr:T9SS type A sorting domain-containing protein [Bacteroidaceae bacterium]MBQ2339424.1 T9SS type A sorting domain-containing protein [Bacteroidaceae bacterium]
MEKRLLLCLLLLIGLGTNAVAQTQQTVTVNGQTVEKTVVQITFDKDQVVLHFSDGLTQTADMDDVSIAFSPSDAESISSLQSNTFTFHGVVNGQLTIGNLQEGTHLTIFNANGQRMMSAQSTGGTTTLQVSQLPAGTYILKAGSQFVKFQKTK